MHSAVEVQHLDAARIYQESQGSKGSSQLLSNYNTVIEMSNEKKITFPVLRKPSCEVNVKCASLSAPLSNGGSPLERKAPGALNNMWHVHARAHTLHIYSVLMCQSFGVAVWKLNL